MINRIAIMGCGSLGTILGAFLNKAGLDVTMVDAWKEHVEALKAHGATVTQGVEMTVPVKAACTPDEMEGTFDLFIYMAKQTFNDTAIPQMVEHCHKDTIIMTCQNGLPELVVAKYWPHSQVYGATVGWPATFLGPGKSALTCSPDAPMFEFHLGTLDGPVTPQVYEIQKILQCMCPKVHITENLMADRWSKVLINSAFSGMSTVLNGTFGDTVQPGKAATCSIRIAREVVRVCAVSNVKLPIIFGIDFNELTAYKTEEEEKAACERIHQTFGGNMGKASMLQDLEKGRKCEISMIDGVVADEGRRVGVPTPYCDAVVKIVSEVEDGKRPLQNNLDAMPDLPFYI